MSADHTYPKGLMHLADPPTLPVEGQRGLLWMLIDGESWGYPCRCTMLKIAPEGEEIPSVAFSFEVIAPREHRGSAASLRYGLDAFFLPHLRQQAAGA